MKNQYFGDIRDLFKYDLILEIMRQCPSLKQFSFIPMLTRDDNRSDGNRRCIDARRLKHRPGSQNAELIEYLRKYDAPEVRDFRKIWDFFEEQGVQTKIYNPADSTQGDYFTYTNRHDYFSNVPDGTLKSSLVFVDPDNGLEVKKPSRKHILYSEVRSLLERMSDDSLLMIYQHFPRENYYTYINWRVQQLRDKTNVDPLWISDNEIIFFFVAKSDVTHSDLESVLSEYSRRYEKCRSICDSLSFQSA